MSQRKHTVYVDISAKIEAWDKVSVIAVSNDSSWALRVSVETKAKAAAMLQGTEPVQYRLMAVLTYIAIRQQLHQIGRIILDADYSGEVAHRLIVRYLVSLIRRDDPNFKASRIKIDNVEGSTADVLARAVYRRKSPANGEIALAEIEEVLVQ